MKKIKKPNAIFTLVFLKLPFIFAVFCALVMPLAVYADDRPGHYSGKPVQDLAQAREFLQQYNQELAAIVNNELLTPVDLNNIHQLTYTLENALEKMASDLALTQAALEALHKASEANATQQVKALAQTYLQQANALQQ